MDSLLLFTLTISLMFTAGQCYSESMSCSTVNGKTVCESQKSAGNVAGSSSSAFTGQGGSYQDANAMTGNTYTGQSSSSRTAAGNAPPPGFMPNIGFNPFAGPTFGGGFGNPAGPSDSANTGTGSTFVTGTSGSDFTGAGGAFAGSAASGFPGAAAGGFAGTAAGGFAGSGGSGVFVGGGFPFSFAIPTFGDGSNGPTGSSASDSANTGIGSTFATSSSDGTGVNGASDGSASGGFVGSAAGGFAGFGGGGVFVGGGAIPGIPFFGTGGGVFVGPQNMFGPGFPFFFGRRR